MPGSVGCTFLENNVDTGDESGGHSHAPIEINAGAEVIANPLVIDGLRSGYLSGPDTKLKGAFPEKFFWWQMSFTIYGLINRCFVLAIAAEYQDMTILITDKLVLLFQL